MSDLIDRQVAIDEIEERKYANGYRNVAVISELNRLEGYIMRLPSAEPKVIHCKDCKWWDSTNGKTGYCHAAKHGYYSTHWEIHIYRTYDDDFYCADAERRTDE